MGIMKTSVIKCILLGIVLCLNCATYAQNQRQELLRQAVHCLAVKNFLPPSKAAKRTFSYLLDEKSYPGEKILYVVDYRDPSRSNSFVFTLFLTGDDGRQGFNVQNNARFSLSKDVDTEVFFVDPPLGGTWIREHLVSAIKEIEKQPRLTISAKDMLAIDSSVVCESYADP